MQQFMVKHVAALAELLSTAGSLFRAQVDDDDTPWCGDKDHTSGRRLAGSAWPSSTFSSCGVCECD